jgi:hypothetical protein
LKRRLASLALGATALAFAAVGCGTQVETSAPAPPVPAVTSSPLPVSVESPTPEPVLSPTSAPAPPAVVPSTPSAAPTTPRPAVSARAAGCSADSYVNVDGNCVHRPVPSSTVPAGATARCQDGAYSFSQHRQGTCSGHGGVATWL